MLETQLPHVDLEPRTAGDRPATTARSLRRLLRATILVAALAIVVDLGVFFLAGRVSDVPGTSGAIFNPTTIALAAAVGSAVGAVGFAVLARVAGRRHRVFYLLVLIVTLASVSTPFQALSGAMPGVAAVSQATGISMLIMHVVTGGIIGILLPILARR